MTTTEIIKNKLLKTAIKCIELSEKEFENPKFEVNLKVSDGRKYKITFERKDLEDLP